jgi:hypothetical protein
VALMGKLLHLLLLNARSFMPAVLDSGTTARDLLCRGTPDRFIRLTCESLYKAKVTPAMRALRPYDDDRRW